MPNRYNMHEFTASIIQYMLEFNIYLVPDKQFSRFKLNFSKF